MILPPSSYPMQGILYFIAHPSLWCSIFCGMFVFAVISIATIIVLFTFGLWGQAQLFINYAGLSVALSYFIAVCLVIFEAALVTLILYAILYPIWVDEVFDKTIRLRGGPATRLLEPNPNRKECRMCLITCGATIRVSILLRIVVGILSFPLHLIPIVGTVMWTYINGLILAWEHNAHYFDLKLYNYGQQQKIVMNLRKNEFASFGVIAQVLEMIPGLSFFFVFTNAVGAALWVADQEELLAESAFQPSPISPPPYDQAVPGASARPPLPRAPDSQSLLLQNEVKPSYG
ncbi:hypothetical protein BKA69DRAFT_1023959 [Paraphysoderma sedebokerense]|nr:hypothetical protein BKA69DRAFT_1023959 [Paraphysoderma sedebokerense]